jgi:hypothetical protein
MGWGAISFEKAFSRYDFDQFFPVGLDTALLLYFLILLDMSDLEDDHQLEMATQLSLESYSAAQQGIFCCYWSYYVQAIVAMLEKIHRRDKLTLTQDHVLT